MCFMNKVCTEQQNKHLFCLYLCYVYDVSFIDCFFNWWESVEFREISLEFQRNPLTFQQNFSGMPEKYSTEILEKYSTGIPVKF